MVPSWSQYTFYNIWLIVGETDLSTYYIDDS